jgi:hypothetical protein
MLLPSLGYQVSSLTISSSRSDSSFLVDFLLEERLKIDRNLSEHDFLERRCEESSPSSSSFGFEGDGLNVEKL